MQCLVSYCKSITSVAYMHSPVPLVESFIDNALSVLSQSGDNTMQKKAYTCLCSLLSCTSASHKAFIETHIATLQQIILESQSTLNAASKKVSQNRCHDLQASSNFFILIMLHIASTNV